MTNVYKITNTVNNKIYIGYTSLSIEDRWNQHKFDALKKESNRKFYNAIRKYGTEVWTLELLCETSTVNEAKEKEISYIALFDSYNTGYNATKGGDGNNGIIMSEESNLKRSQALKGKKKSPETIEKFKARTQTEETNAKIGRAHLGKKKPWVKWNHEQIVKRAMTRRGITKDQYDEIHRLRKEGHIIRDIAEKVGCSYDLTKKWLKKNWEL